MSKVERCDKYLSEFADDEALVRGYSAKRSKEYTAAQNLYSPEAMRAAYEQAEAACQELERVLQNGASPWLFGETVTMADIYWAIELLRMENMGADNFWKGGALPTVAAYLERAKTLSPVRSAVLDWPNAMFQ